MRGITFTNTNIVGYLDLNDKYGEEKLQWIQMEDYFNTLDSYLSNQRNSIYLEYNKENNVFTLYREDNQKYEFIPTKKQMEEFINNKDTIFNNRVRKCLKLSEEKKRFFEIQEKGSFESPEDALFFANYLNDREDFDNPFLDKAKEYIVKNANKDFDKYIDLFNTEIEKLKEKNNKIKEETKELIKWPILLNIICAPSFLGLIAVFNTMPDENTALTILFTFVFSVASLIFIVDYSIDAKKDINDNNKKIKDVEDIIERLKTKELELSKNNSNKEELKETKEERHIDEFERQLVSVFFNNEFNLFKSGTKEDFKKVAMLIGDYREEIESASLEEGNAIKDKYMKKANDFRQEVLSRSNLSTQMITEEINNEINKIKEARNSQAMIKVLKPNK